MPEESVFLPPLTDLRAYPNYSGVRQLAVGITGASSLTPGVMGYSDGL